MCHRFWCPKTSGVTQWLQILSIIAPCEGGMAHQTTKRSNNTVGVHWSALEAGVDGGNQKGYGTMILHAFVHTSLDTTRISRRLRSETGFRKVYNWCVSRILTSGLYARHPTRAQQKRLAPYSVIVHHVDICWMQLHISEKCACVYIILIHCCNWWSQSNNCCNQSQPEVSKSNMPL